MFPIVQVDDNACLTEQGGRNLVEVVKHLDKIMKCCGHKNRMTLVFTSAFHRLDCLFFYSMNDFKLMCNDTNCKFLYGSGVLLGIYTERDENVSNIHNV